MTPREPAAQSTAGGRPRPRRGLSRISYRLLAWNLLLVFVPLAGVFYLGVFEEKLLAAQERSMVQQGRLLAAALSDEGGLESDGAEALLERLDLRLTARLRVVGPDGSLVADSSRLGPRAPQEEAAALAADDPRASWLYRVGSALFRSLAPWWGPDVQAPAEAEFYEAGRPLLGPEIRAALDGRYGAATRVSPGQRSLTLYSAIPVRSDGGVVGAVLVSQSTYRVLQDLYEERLAIFQVFLVSVAAAGVLTLFVSTTISRPLRRLRAQALDLVDRRGRMRGELDGSRRRDEIGDLARALETLSERLSSRIRFMESLAADVSHAFKNPLAGIRAAFEMASSADVPEDRARYEAMVEEEVARLERLLTTLRDVAALDAAAPPDDVGRVPLRALLDGLLAGFRVRLGGSLRFELEAPAECFTLGSAERLGQAFENLVDNAAGFSPPGGTVRVVLAGRGGLARVEVHDDGPGIPDEHRERVFDRFFSYRPHGASSDEDIVGGHAGLGLAIARAVLEAHGGSLEVGAASVGATMVATLPVADPAPAAP